MPRSRGAARRAEILAASGRLVRRRGFTTTRLADVASELGLSAPLIVYHFGSKDELMAATLGAEVAAEMDRLEVVVASRSAPAAKIERILRMSLGPAAVADWALWIDAWGEGLRSAVMRRHLEDLDRRWQQAFETVIVEGQVSGAFAVADSVTAAQRIMALLDGYGVQLVRAASRRARAGVLADARRAVADELARA